MCFSLVIGVTQLPSMKMGLSFYVSCHPLSKWQYFRHISNDIQGSRILPLQDCRPLNVSHTRACKGML